uniref:Interleukin-5 n=1 Tax=Sarcophilus harrisii TaxID=9305 RepID=A0A7N4V4I9_SARHA
GPPHQIRNHVPPTIPRRFQLASAPPPSGTNPRPFRFLARERARELLLYFIFFKLLPEYLCSCLRTEVRAFPHPLEARRCRGRKQSKLPHRTLLIGNGTLRISIPDPKNHPLCIEEIFQGIETLKNQTAEDNVVERIFQNFSSLKEHITTKEKQCGGERRKVEQFLDYLEEFLQTVNTEWTVES